MSLQEQLRSVWSQRYGRAAPEPLAAANPTLNSLLQHKSVRAFQSTPLPDGYLELLVAAAQSAPSSSNLQVWSLVAVTEAERKQRLSVLARAQAHIVEAPLLLVFVADLSRVQALGQAQQRPVDGIEYWDSLLMGFIDATLAAQNVVVAAESLGLGTVYIGALRNQPEAVAAELGLPPKVAPAFGLLVGYPDPERPAAIKPRLPQQSILHREQYQATRAEDIADYDDILQQFQASQNLPQQPWSVQSVERLKGPESLSGRDRLTQALTNLGFGLK